MSISPTENAVPSRPVPPLMRRLEIPLPDTEPTRIGTTPAAGSRRNPFEGLRVRLVPTGGETSPPARRQHAEP